MQHVTISCKLFQQRKLHVCHLEFYNVKHGPNRPQLEMQRQGFSSTGIYQFNGEAIPEYAFPTSDTPVKSNSLYFTTVLLIKL